MPNYTSNFNLKKPLPDEFYNIQDHNDNMDIIDNALKTAPDSVPADKTTLVDTDSVVISDSADSGKRKKVLWSKIKELLANTFAAKSHTHTKSDISNFAHTHTKSEISDFSHKHSKADISDFPSTMTPSAHTHKKADISDFPSTMTPSAHKSTHAKNGSDPIAPADIGAVEIGEHYGDMNTLVTSGVYRVGTNANLDEQLWYSQVIVLKGLNTDTISQLGVSYTDGKIVVRSGQYADSKWTFTDWATCYSDKNKPSAFDVGALPLSGGSLTGALAIGNTTMYEGLTKTRNINGSVFYNVFGIGSDTSKGASSSVRLTDEEGNVKGRLDLWSNGTITYTTDQTTYHQLIGEHNFSTMDLVAKTDADYTTHRVRNIYANTTTMTANSTAMTRGEIYLQYE